MASFARRKFLGGAAAAPFLLEAEQSVAASPARRYDAIVCGGGTAGRPAAISLARRGAKVAIIERYGFLGGNVASSIMPCWHGLKDHHSGLLTEFATRVRDSGWGPDPLFDNHMEPEAVKMLFLMLSQEEGVELILHRFIVGAETRR